MNKANTACQIALRNNKNNRSVDVQLCVAHGVGFFVGGDLGGKEEDVEEEEEKNEKDENEKEDVRTWFMVWMCRRATFRWCWLKRGFRRFCLRSWMQSSRRKKGLVGTVRGVGSLESGCDG